MNYQTNKKILIGTLEEVESSLRESKRSFRVHALLSSGSANAKSEFVYQSAIFFLLLL